MDSLAGPLVFAAVLGLIPARIAAAKGRNFALWWFYGWMLLIVAIPHALLLRPAERHAEAGGPARPWAPARLAPTPPVAPVDEQPKPWAPPMAPCPSCHEEVRADTPMCPFCSATISG